MNKIAPLNFLHWNNKINLMAEIASVCYLNETVRPYTRSKLYFRSLDIMLILCKLSFYLSCNIWCESKLAKWKLHNFELGSQKIKCLSVLSFNVWHSASLPLKVLFQMMFPLWQTFSKLKKVDMMMALKCSLQTF